MSQPGGAAGRAPRLGRLAWIDWLKMIVVLGVFAYHAAQPFVLTTTWLVVDDEKSYLLSALAGLGYLFGMPLMFLLAGGASWIALQRSAPGLYVRKRLRLAVPLVAGIAILAPLQTWIGSLTRGETKPLSTYAAEFWATAKLPTGPIWLGDYGYHLWFIGFLLIYAIASVPLLVRMRPGTDARLSQDRWILALPLSALLTSQLPLRVAFPAYRDWADFALWFVYFLIGAAVIARPAWLHAVTDRGLLMLVPGTLLAVGLIPIFLSGSGLVLESTPRFDAASLAYIAMRTMVGWCWVLVAVAIGARWLDRRPVEARAASGLVLPFYVLHHPIVVVVAAVVVAWPVSGGLKFLAILGGSLALTLVLCLAAVRTRFLRPLIGLDRTPSHQPVGTVAT